MPTAKKIYRHREKPATRSDIYSIVGPLDENIVTAILNIGATRTEITQAFNWLTENHYTMSIFARPMNERMRRVYDILDYASNDFNGAPPWR